METKEKIEVLEEFAKESEPTSGIRPIRVRAYVALCSSLASLKREETAGKMLPKKAKFYQKLHKIICYHELKKSTGLIYDIQNIIDSIFSDCLPSFQALLKDNEELRYVAKSASGICEKQLYEIADLKKKLDRATVEGMPKIICICGSTRFADMHAIKRWEFEKNGKAICLMINYFPMAYAKKIGLSGGDHFGEKLGLKEILDELHLRKIDLADEVFVINVDGYIGKSTRNEIAYAEKLGKPIKYMEALHDYIHKGDPNAKG